MLVEGFSRSNPSAGCKREQVKVGCVGPRIQAHEPLTPSCIRAASSAPLRWRRAFGSTGGTHKTPAIKAWFARNPRFHVHFTPTSASWLNQVERWFATLTQNYIRRGTHRSTRQLEQAIRQYLDVHNSDPKPFVWSKSADDILASLEHSCLRTSNSRH
jgi:hypothetical protein